MNNFKSPSHKSSNKQATAPTVFDEAKTFLQLLDPDATDFTFSVLPETEGCTEPATTRHGKLGELVGWLSERNSVGFGVFVTVNETNLKGRKAEDITQIRAVWHEDDIGYEGSFPLQPSMTIQTSEGKFHRYWLVEGGWPADDLGKADFADVMQAMKIYGTDPSATDLPRLLRLPGTYHVKGKPQLVKIAEANGQRYSREVVLNAFAPVRNSVENISEPRSEPRVFSNQDLKRAKGAINFIPADSRESWLPVAMALHATVGDEDAYAILDDWSRTCPSKYDSKENRRQWDSFKDYDDGKIKTIASIFELGKQHGWQETCELAPKPPRSEEPLSLTPGELTQRAMKNIVDKFKQRNTNPSQSEWNGLQQIALTIQGMADQNLPPMFYLSSLSPGVGKTSVTCEAIRTLLAMESYRDVGVILFLSRCEEIKHLIENASLREDDYAVLVSEKGEYAELNKCGNLNAGKARVLITTQQRLELYCRDERTFADISEFHFNGKPRRVRVWDEAILPSTILTVGKYDISDLLKICVQNDAVVGSATEELFNELSKAADRAIVDVPDLQSIIELHTFRDWFSDGADKDVAEALWKLSGRSVRVRKDMEGNTALDYEDTFPDDLAPLLILDASGQQRNTYELWYANRKGLQFLPSPQKDYSPLKVHHWNRGAGKSKRTDWDEIFDGVAKTINGLPKEHKILVVHFKHGRYVPDIPEMIRDRIGSDSRVSFCTWGKHTATNEFAECRHVILAGVLQYSTSQNEAHGRGAKGIKTEDEFTDEEHRDTRLGEIAHNILQAACRGSVRRSEGNTCPAGCTLWLIFSSHRSTGIPRELLDRIFPGAMIQDWAPLPKKLTGQAKTLINILDTVTDGIGVGKTYVQEVLGISDRRNFNRLIRRRDVQEWMTAIGVQLEGDLFKRIDDRPSSKSAHLKMYDKVYRAELPY